MGKEIFLGNAQQLGADFYVNHVDEFDVRVRLDQLANCALDSGGIIQLVAKGDSYIARLGSSFVEDKGSCYSFFDGTGDSVLSGHDCVLLSVSSWIGNRGNW